MVFSAGFTSFITPWRSEARCWTEGTRRARR